MPVPPGAPPPLGAPLALKKGVLLDMLPEKMSFAERFMLAKDVGFDVVQAPTMPNQQTAEEIKQAADKAGIGIDSVMNMAHWEFPLSSSDPAAVEKSLAAMRISLHNAKLFGVAMSCCSSPESVNPADLVPRCLGALAKRDSQADRSRCGTKSGHCHRGSVEQVPPKPP